MSPVLKLDFFCEINTHDVPGTVGPPGTPIPASSALGRSGPSVAAPPPGQSEVQPPGTTNTNNYNKLN